MQAVLSGHRRERDPQDGDASQGHDHMEHIHCCLCLEDAHGIPVDASHPRSVKATVMLRVEFSFAGKKRIGHKASKHGHSPRGEACEDACLDPLTHPRPALSAPPRRPSPRLVSHPMSSPFLHPLHTIQNHPSPFNEPFPHAIPSHPQEPFIFPNIPFSTAWPLYYWRGCLKTRRNRTPSSSTKRYPNGREYGLTKDRLVLSG